MDSFDNGVLVTGTLAEKPKQERLIIQNWERHYSREQWTALSKEERENFLLKCTLSEIVMDLDGCLARNKVNPRKAFEEKGLLRMFMGDIASSLRGLSIQATNKLDEMCSANYALHMIDDYEMLMSQKEKENIELRSKAQQQEALIQNLKRKVDTTEENKANLNVFTSFQEDYQTMMNELLSEMRAREEVIETLSTKLYKNEERHREYRFAFGNVSQVEDKLKKMNKLYNDKLMTCFDHYARTMATVYSDAKKVSLISDRLKQLEISPSKASGDLSVIATSLENQINCFEKFFNKHRTTTEIGQVVEMYVKSKEEAKKGINQVIYLQELAKFKERSQQASPTEKIKATYVERLKNMDKRFRGQIKDSDLKTSNSKLPKALDHFRQSYGTLSASQRKVAILDEANPKDQLSARKEAYRPSIQTKATGTEQGSRPMYKLNRVSSAQSLRQSQRGK